ncbi:MAG: hybrid sensor histidine kinase/response regulator [Desulfuromonadales bacterium]|nr:hybrid sensor histidine kinase/response regulator [Desulfuromonadales bacterium]
MNKNKYVEIFAREAEEHLQLMRQGLLAMEKGGASGEQFNQLLRSAHTLKGSARMVDLLELSTVAHHMEDLLKELQGGGRELSPAVVDLLLVATDAIEALLAQASAGGTLSVNVAPIIEALRAGALPEQTIESAATNAAHPGVERRRSVRASVERLDQLTNCMGEILLSRQALAERQRQLLTLIPVMDSFLVQLHRTENHQRMKELRSSFVRIVSDLEQDTVHLGYQAEDIYQRAMELRLLPLATITEDFERSLRDLARTLGKELDFTVTGKEVELDRTVLDLIKPMLLHVLNNAVDHGIETPETRLHAGKPSFGRVHLSAQYEGAFIQIVVSDDGQGIDPAKVRGAAVKRGLLSADEAARLSDEAALYLVLQPGFSTREFITDVSGRGVGLDVVKTNLDQVKGNLTLSSKIGQGTEMRLRVPSSLAMFTGLLVEADGETYVIPQQYIVEILRLAPTEVRTELGREVVRLRERTIPLVSLAGLLSGASRSIEDELPEGRVSVVVLNFRDQLLGCLVDRAIGLHDVVVKGLGSQLKSLDYISGATLLGAGTPALIVSVADLYGARQTSEGTRLREAHAARQASAKRGRVLVVDDSITTRTMEKNILETHGYDVTIAVSGFDALEKLSGNSFDLMVSDVEMPGMTGFELTKKVREREETRALPVIIVTSLASADDRRRGMEAGAQAYIVKGTFDQGVLLETVEALID